MQPKTVIKNIALNFHNAGAGNGFISETTSLKKTIREFPFTATEVSKMLSHHTGIFNRYELNAPSLVTKKYNSTR